MSKQYEEAKCLLGKSINFMVRLTIAFMVSLSFVGIIFIDSEIGNKELKAYLRDEDNNSTVIGNITCKDKSDRVILDIDNVFCLIFPELENVSTDLAFTFSDRTREEKSFKGLNFWALPDVKYVEFYITGVDSEGNHRRFSAVSKYHFLTEQG